MATSNTKPHEWKPGQSGNPAGRPKGAYKAGLDDRKLREIAEQGITPLEYLLAVVRAPSSPERPVPMAMKIEAAKAAAPYMHKKMPIAIEGGDPDRPLRLDAQALGKLSSTELATLRVLLVKTGLTAGLAVAQEQGDGDNAEA